MCQKPEKERNILILIETGITNKEIATKLGISITTVRTHINNLYSKLQVDDRLQAVARAKKLGIL